MFRKIILFQDQNWYFVLDRIFDNEEIASKYLDGVVGDKVYPFALLLDHGNLHAVYIPQALYVNRR